MMYIDLQLIEQFKPAGWDEQATEAANDVAAARPQNRSAEVSKRSQIWRDLKQALRSASHSKCWYCESIESRSDNAVDHYRPKNAVAECPGHDGYWWLAFDKTNYRFCCTFCNSRRVDQNTGQTGGKAGCFPLRDESHRAKTPQCNLLDEEPMLLDPINPADPGFLWFEETGRSVPHPVCGTNNKGYLFLRATTSIELYHLNHTDVVERRKALCRWIRRRVEEADRYYRKYGSGDRTARQAFEDAIGELRSCLAQEAEYSAAAKSMLMGLRATYPVVEVVLAGA